ncbi:Flagellar brake protein YcgR [Planctomycetes bacterium Poly30]|uniref:Flagellar brake protein YcgR n=1 Tax=Saltatorellus ferox TaxID=2528018 RepID=A0A518EN31_9BACT|nr:Flagellar brake protein YcgR [Planctomycetes bacterium Poly30]
MKLPIFSPENRSTYRVSIPEGQGMLWVGLSAGPVKVRMDDVSSRGCGFTLGAEEAAGLAEGSELVLRMKIGDPKAPQLFIRSEIRSLRSEGELVHIGALFKECDRLYQQLDVSQWRYFNRRGAFRVPPVNHRGEPLRASFYAKGSEERVRFTVNDLSSSGLAIRLSGSQEYQLSETQCVRSTFELPGVPDPLDLQLRFIHRTFIKGVERIGFMIDMRATAVAEVQSETILRYVMERQSQLLRG